MHLEKPANRKWLEQLPADYGPSSVLLVAGDLGVSVTQIREGLEQFKQRFSEVPMSSSLSSGSVCVRCVVLCAV